MGLRTAALYGHDPRTLRMAAEMLALRGVHPTPEQAEAALEKVRTSGPPAQAHRAPLAAGIGAGRPLHPRLRRLLSPPTSDEAKRDVAHPKLKAAAGIAFGAAIWVTTWVLPVTIMVAMAGGCETHTRQLRRRILLFYDGEADSTRAAIQEADERSDHGHDRRQLLRTMALFLSIAIPIGFVAVVDHYRQSTGISWLGALVALSLVVATAVVASRRS
jgi:hypothetical protein